MLSVQASSRRRGLSKQIHALCVLLLKGFSDGGCGLRVVAFYLLLGQILLFQVKPFGFCVCLRLVDARLDLVGHHVVVLQLLHEVTFHGLDYLGVEAVGLFQESHHWDADEEEFGLRHVGERRIEHEQRAL